MKFFQKYSLLLALGLCLQGTVALAQSSMTDDQVIEYVKKQNEKGVSQGQILSQLMERGVDIQQIRRIKKKVQKKAANSTGVALEKEGLTDETGRLRNNPDTKDLKTSPFMKEEQLNKKNVPTQRKEMADELEEITAIDSLSTTQQKMNNLHNGKEVFGRNIFNNESLTFEPQMNIATPKNYVLGPGDAVFVDIYGASQKSMEATVTPDGNIVIDGWGPVQVSGLTIQQANARLRQGMGQRYADSKISLSLGQTRTISVNVMGEVVAPGTYSLSAFAGVFHALYMAGGVNSIGTLRNIKVYRHGKQITTVDVYDYILNGKLKGDVRLSDGDVIVVDAYDALVDLSGKIKRPMIYEMKKGESLAALIKYGGDFTGDAYRKSVRVERKTGQDYSIFNVSEFEMGNFSLSDEDMVSVDSVIARYNNMVELKGAVFRPGKYQVGKEITSVGTLVKFADGVTEDAFCDHVVIHRMKEDRTLEVVAVDLKGIMNGSVPDVALRNEDVVFIPSKQDLREEQILTIYGEVYYPGKYQYASNETIEDLILQAGGLKEAASVVKVDVSRRIINPRATESDSVIAQTFSFALKDGFVLDGTPGFILQPYDEIYVRKSPGYFTPQNVAVTGEILFEGTYTLSQKNTCLSDIIKAAGGLNDRAYAQGARLERQLTYDEKLRMKSLLKLARQQSGESDSLDVEKLDLGESYYVGIELNKALANPGSDDDIVLREGDKIIIPQYTNTVKISGNVMYPNTVTFDKKKGTDYYINQAGGFGNRAKKSHTYIIYMNGKVAKVGHGVKPAPGCEIVVPTKPKRTGSSVAEWLGIGTSAASIATMIATIANL